MITLPDRIANEIWEMVEDARQWGVMDVEQVISEVRECWIESLRQEQQRIQANERKQKAKR